MILIYEGNIVSLWVQLGAKPAALGPLLDEHGGSLGLALAAGLLCYAVALDVPSTLMVTGAVLVGSLWWARAAAGCAPRSAG